MTSDQIAELTVMAQEHVAIAHSMESKMEHINTVLDNTNKILENLIIESTEALKTIEKYSYLFEK